VTTAAAPETTVAPGPRNGVGRRLSRSLSRHPRAQLGGLLTGPLLWLVVIYLGSLAALLVTSLYTTDDFTGAIVKTVSLGNFKDLVTNPTFRAVTFRTLGIALAVTVIDLALALPISFFMAKVANRRTRRIIAVALVLPLWASYLVKAYCWRVIFDPAAR
jgi:putative spermidine/putrescine transport system permease protein